MTSADPAPSAPPHRDHPDVMAVCRWLPQPYPWGAFTGRHDYVHAGQRHGRTNLWWADFCVHPGDYVGPPRGGLVPDPYADYDVAMPAGGYLQIRSGVFTGWADDRSDSAVLRADGEQFRSEQYGPANPYFVSQYRCMSDDDRANALAGVRQQRDAATADQQGTAVARHRELVAAVAERVAAARDPESCGCTQTLATRRNTGMGVPGALLRHGGVVATLTGIGDADTACDVIWNLTAALADPDRAGIVRAAENAARRAADTMAGWPDGPLTEDAVALVAAQALRWHGQRIVGDLPFWVLGWIFIARPVFETLLPPASQTDRNRLARMILRHADQVRVDRVTRTWQATQRAGELLDSFARAAAEATPTAAPVIDLRESDSTPDPAPAVAGPARVPAYERSVAAVVAELAG